MHGDAMSVFVRHRPPEWPIDEGASTDAYPHSAAAEAGNLLIGEAVVQRLPTKNDAALGGRMCGEPAVHAADRVTVQPARVPVEAGLGGRG
jgi:hypothetical protein